MSRRSNLLWPILLALLACDQSARMTPAPDLDAAPSADAGDQPMDSETSAGDDGGEEADGALAALRVFVFTRTTGYRHESISAAQAALRALDTATYSFEFSEDPAQLSRALAHSDVVAFVLTSGDVLDEAQQIALETFVRAGGGFVGVHSAADTEYDWPFYVQLVGARFASHPAIQPARVVVEAAMHPSVGFLPASWERSDEWYNFKENPRAQVEVLLRVDEASYQGGTHGSDHPIAWSRELDAGRTLYTALGHTDQSWSEPYFVRHVAEALLWAGRRARSGE